MYFEIFIHCYYSKRSRVVEKRDLRWHEDKILLIMIMYIYRSNESSLYDLVIQFMKNKIRENKNKNLNCSGLGLFCITFELQFITR